MLKRGLKLDSNNTIEYEVLVQGLYKAIDLEVKYLQVYGDSKIVIDKVRNTIQFFPNHLKHYQYLIQYLTSHLISFDILPIPRLQNAIANLLAIVASKLIPPEYFNRDSFSIELIFFPQFQITKPNGEFLTIIIIF